jgi:hypothetical protein
MPITDVLAGVVASLPAPGRGPLRSAGRGSALTAKERFRNTRSARLSSKAIRYTEEKS